MAQYLYCDERGEPLYRVVRSDPKSFRLESFNGEGWQHGRDCMQGVRRVLYRLSDVLVAVAAGEAIYITEGEKDADLVATRGECATTNAGGAGKWSTIPDAQEVLRGAQVFVVADRDLAGWRRALEVRETLSRVAHVTVVASAVGKDFGDHVEAGYGLNDLVVRDPGLEMAGLEMDQEAEVITYSRVPRAISRNPRLDDADVRLFAVVDEMPGRTISGRNFVAKVLGWRPAKVTEHAEHLVAAGFFHVTEHPSGDGHKATTYRAVNNPVREGSGSDSSHLRARGGSDSSRPGRGSGSLSVHSHSLSESECAYAVFEGGREDDFVGAPFFDIDDDRVDEILESDDDPGPNDRDLERYGGGDEPVRTA